jgi:hypothetical protein
MGVVGRVLGVARAAEAIGAAAEGVSEVFVPNATRAIELDAAIHRATLETAMAEFQHAGNSWFDAAINGLNRLPRPMLALGTMGLFVFAMVDPEGFGARMLGLALVPEPLWWLLGAIVSFYFGARELHYMRAPILAQRAGRARPRPAVAQDPRMDNPALSAWRAGQDQSSPRSERAAAPRSQ